MSKDCSARHIAAMLGRHHSMIFREVPGRSSVTAALRRTGRWMRRFVVT
ncbi:helix-turn-helix domain-containing protein [Frankia sp. Cr1]